MSGVSAALEAARLGRRVVIVDAAPALGGQAVGSIIGTIIGLYTHGERPYQITHGIADDLIADLTAEGSMHRRQSATGTITFLYDEVRLGRWVERKMQEAGVRSIVGAVLTDVAVDGGRIRHIELATRFGSVRIAAQGYVDASGDATLSYEAGFEVREPDAPVFGSLNFVIENYDADAAATMVIADVHARLAEKGGAYGLVRHDGFLMHFPGKNQMLANVTHFETPLDPMATGQMVIDGRAQADRVLAFLRAEFPAIFAHAQIRAYGMPGIRQTRWIVGRHQLTLDEIKVGAAATRRGGALCVVGGAARRAGAGALGEVRAGPRLLHPARVHGAEGGRERRGRRPLRGRGPAGAVGDPRHRSLHRHGRRRRARARPRRARPGARGRHGRAAGAPHRQSGSKRLILLVAVGLLLRVGPSSETKCVEALSAPRRAPPAGRPEPEGAERERGRFGHLRGSAGPRTSRIGHAPHVRQRSSYQGGSRTRSRHSAGRDPRRGIHPLDH